MSKPRTFTASRRQESHVYDDILASPRRKPGRALDWRFARWIRLAPE